MDTKKTNVVNVYNGFNLTAVEGGQELGLKIFNVPNP